MLRIKNFLVDKDVIDKQYFVEESLMDGNGYENIFDFDKNLVAEARALLNKDPKDVTFNDIKSLDKLVPYIMSNPTKMDSDYAKEFSRLNNVLNSLFNISKTAETTDAVVKAKRVITDYLLVKNPDDVTKQDLVNVIEVLEPIKDKIGIERGFGRKLNQEEIIEKIIQR